MNILSYILFGCSEPYFRKQPTRSIDKIFHVATVFNPPHMAKYTYWITITETFKPGLFP
jgi:hypothetical protein